MEWFVSHDTDDRSGKLLAKPLFSISFMNRRLHQCPALMPKLAAQTSLVGVALWGIFSLAVSSLLMTALLRASENTVERGSRMHWRQLPTLPDKTGFGGLFAGISAGKLIVAGGANFPDRMPWDGGTKQYHRTVYILDSPSSTWREVGALPRPTAYGISIATEAGILCVGGNDLEHTFADCFLLRVEGNRLAFETIAPLPKPLTAACGVAIGRIAYICGGVGTADGLASDAVSSLLRLDLNDRSKGWQECESLPGPGRFHAVAAALGDSLFVISGLRRKRTNESAFELEYLEDAYRYTLDQTGKGRWVRLADLPHPNAAAPSPAMPLDAQRIVLFGSGADGLHLQPPPQDRPPPSSTCLAYNTATNDWTPLGTTPAPRMTVPTVVWNGEWIVPSGEVRPGRRSPHVWAVRSSADGNE